MRYAIKREGLQIRACRLGDDTGLERMLMERGQVVLRPDGRYEVFSQEARDGRGQLAQPGDYVKLDDMDMPYPNDKAFFEANHTRIGPELYLQKPSPVGAWQADEPMCPEVEFLLREKGLTLDPSDEAHYFRAVLWGAPLSAPRDAVLVFYRIDRDESGQICDASFNFVVREFFDRNYQWIGG